MTACPPAEELLELAAGRLSEAALASVETHIDGCAACRAALSSLAKSDAPSGSFGRYRLESVLGSGGMGIVYRAWDPQLARPVAIKVVRHASADAQLRTRLVREAQSLARLSHPNVCHCYDVGTDGDEVWVAMELIDGITLRAWAVEKSYGDVLEVLLGAGEGIAAAHAGGLIHRDIKPENVLVTRAGRPVVTDFGLARVDLPVDPSGSTMSGDPALTATGAIVGTPAYLAPEQLTGDVLDARVDQFAWAVMAWELLTGTRPFPVIAAIRLDAVRAGITAPASLPKPVAVALTRAMALAPRDRYPSMRALIDAIRVRPAKRTPAIIGGAAVLATGATLAVWQLRERPAVAPPPDAAPIAIVTPDAVAAPVEIPLDASVARVAPKETPKPTPKPPLRPLDNPTFSRERLFAVMMSECKLPIDPKRPDPALGTTGVLDWGPVTRKETVIAKVADRESYMALLEVRGARATYRFDADFDVMGVLDVEVGEQLVVCPDPNRPEKIEIYQLPAAWTGGLDIMSAALPLTGKPLVSQLADLAPLYVEERVLNISAARGKLQMSPASYYLVRARPLALAGGRWEMERGWWLEVGNVPGAKLVTAKQRMWFVIEPPTFEPAGDQPKMSAKAVRVIAELLPH